MSNFTHNASSKEVYGLEASHLKNGTIISSILTYDNSIRDTVGGANTSQQRSIETKLAEIADSLTVLPALTQKIDNLEAKVSSLETLLNERTSLLLQCNNSLNVTTEEMLREQPNKQACPLKINGNDRDAEAVNQSRNIRPAANIRDDFWIQNRRRRTRDMHTKKSALSDRNMQSSPMDGTNNADTTAEIIISNICNRTDEQRADVVHSVLSAFLPSIGRDNIMSTRLL